MRLPNGNYLIGGAEDDMSLLAEVTPNGKLEWSRTFDALAGVEMIFHMVLDKEGKVLCIGNDGSTYRNAFLAKFNPLSQSLDWVSVLDVFDHQAMHILDPDANGPYYVMGQDQTAPAQGLGNDAFLQAVDRNTGELLSDCQNNFNLGSSESFGYGVFYEGNFYTAGRFNSAGGGVNKMRMAINRLDASGNLIWSRLVVQPESVDALTFATDITVKDGYIYFIGFGDPDGTSTVEREAFFGKMTLDGDLLWAREYDFGANIVQIFRAMRSTEQGFVISCTDWTNGRRGFVHVDNEGNILDSGQYSESAMGFILRGPKQYAGRRIRHVQRVYFTCVYLPRLSLDS